MVGVTGGAPPRDAAELLARLNARQGRAVTFMEVCGTHTMAVARSGLRGLLPPSIRLISGPGCPVCVTPVGFIDHCLALAEKEEVMVTTFGDLMRVPGSVKEGDAGPVCTLSNAKALGARVTPVYSPLEALDIAKQEPDCEVVFLGVGFETTAPGLAATVLQAEREGVANFSMLVAAKTIPMALEVLATAEELALDGFLCPGHVSVILGEQVYHPLVETHGMSCAIAGFEPKEILLGICALVDQVDGALTRVENCYPGPVRPTGNPKALTVMNRVFEGCDSVWRGLGAIPRSGLRLRPEFRVYDAAQRFDVTLPRPVEPRGCRCGDVLRGVLDPKECGLFGKRCTPEDPQGACMVSQEGSCAARYLYLGGGDA